MSDDIVILEHVSKNYDTVQAVGDVSFSVRRGEFVSLLGPSGCGKSSILRMIAGFERPNTGSILIDGVNVVDVPPHQRPVNLVFQSYALFPHLSVFDNVAFGLRRKRVAKPEIDEQVHRFLRLAGLEALADRYPSQLSGGQQQRVALARALVNQPKVLLLDEPLGALDLKLRKRMQIELKQLQREVGISFIYVTHDQDEALALSDRIAVMNTGELLQFAPGRELYDEPRTQFVANFLGESNILHGRVVASGSSPRAEVGGHQVAIRLSRDDAFQLGDQVLLSIRPEQMTLDATAEGGNQLPATVAEKVFLGNAFNIFLRLDSDIPCMVRGTDRALFDQLSPGQRVAVNWRPEQARVLAS
jgi:spermidine/putrescine transport system ATP-binding protein